MKSIILGLDIGCNSIGWAVIEVSEGVPERILGIGSRVFEAGADGAIEQGKEESRGVKRRTARLHRRQLWRRQRRRRKLFHELQKVGLLPPDPRRTSKEMHQCISELDAATRQRHMAENPLAGTLLPYWLRARGLDVALAPYEFGRAIFHLAQRRGFKSNRKEAPADAKETGIVYGGISAIDTAMKTMGARTLGEYFSKVDPHTAKIRRCHTSRKMYEDEFSILWESQIANHKFDAVDARKKLHDAIFRQRPLKSCSHLVGKCELEPNKRRARAALPISQRFRILAMVNNLRVQLPGSPESAPLSGTRRDMLLDALASKSKLSMAAARKLLSLPPGAQFTIEEGGEKNLKGDSTTTQIVEAMGAAKWKSISDAIPVIAERLVDDLLAYQDADALKARLMKGFALSPTEQTAARAVGLISASEARLTFSDLEATALAKARLTDDRVPYSERALAKLVPAMEAGLTVTEAIRQEYPATIANTDPLDELPACATLLKELRNPVVSRTLTELRKVVNALLRRWGKPDQIRIELGRDLKRSKGERKEMVGQMRERQAERDGANVALEGVIADPKRRDTERMLLYRECKEMCPYTGRALSMDDVFGAHPSVDVDHIIPFSRCLDDSFGNKTLCDAEFNRLRKSNRTPLEVFAANSTEYDRVIMRVKGFNGPRALVAAKLKRFQMLDKDIEERAAHQLNDTRHASKLACRYLGALYGGEVDASGKRRVEATSGMVTAFLRREWDMNMVLGGTPEKNRNDYRHHAVDAVAIACTTPTIVKRLSTAAGRAREENRRLFGKCDRPWPKFDEDLRAQAEAVIVSHRPEHKLYGSMHDETRYGGPIARGRPDDPLPVRIRKPINSLKIKDIDQIIDPLVREAVRAKLGASTTPDKAFDPNDPSTLPHLPSKSGRPVPIKKVRLETKMSVVPIGEAERMRYVAPRNNHHMEIIEVKSRTGKIKWEGRVVTRIEAYQRKALRLPVVCKYVPNGGKFICTVRAGDSVELRAGDDPHGVYVVRGVTEGRVTLLDVRDARPKKNLKTGELIVRAPNALKTADARRVTVTHDGQIQPCNE